MSSSTPASATDRAALGTGSTAEAVPRYPEVARRGFIRRQPTMVAGLACLALILAAGVAAPYLGTVDPSSLRPITRLHEPGGEFWFGTDQYGRDIYSRTLYGARISLLVGVTVGVGGMAFGILIGLVTGYYRRLDRIVMRVMDGLMAIPAILLALALMALLKASVRNVIVALVIPEIPRVVRVVRASVLSLREQTMVEAARALGAETPRILRVYILPALVAPLIVQGTYICASAMLFEAYLSFLGAGTPPNIPSWGNIMAEGRAYVQRAFWIILFPGAFLAATVLAVNLVGDGLRDRLKVK
jgi:peptide/nickel transport system permease protein